MKQLRPTPTIIEQFPKTKSIKEMTHHEHRSPGAGLDNFDRTFLRELSCQSFLIVVPFEKPVQQRQDHFESLASPEVRDDLLFDFAILANRANDADILVDSAIGRRNFDRSNEHLIIITILNPLVNTYIR